MKKTVSFTVLFAILITLLPQSTYTVYAATTGIKKVAAGANHTAVIMTDNTLWLCGSNSSGQLGIGDKADTDDQANSDGQAGSFDPIQVMDGVKDVALGHSTTIALKTDGSVWVWGYNADEELGTKAKPKVTGGIEKADDSNIISTPTQLMSGVKAIAAGDGYMMALKTDGSLYTWGSNECYQLGIDKMEVGSRGRLVCYKPTKILTGVASISAGGYHAAAVKTDGSLYIWGENTPYSQCGLITQGSFVRKPTKIMDSGVKAVSCSDKTTAILKTDKTLWMCGDNRSGQLGTGDKDIQGKSSTRQQEPVKVLSGVKAVSALDGCTLAVKTDGTLWVAGKYTTNKISLEFVQYMDDVASLATNALMVIKTDATLWVWGNRNTLGTSSPGRRTLGYYHTSTPIQIVISSAS